MDEPKYKIGDIVQYKGLPHKVTWLALGENEDVVYHIRYRVTLYGGDDNYIDRYFIKEEELDEH